MGIIESIQVLISLTFFVIQIKLMIDIKKIGKSLSGMIREGKLCKLLMYMSGSYLILEIMEGIFYDNFSVFIFVVWGGLFTLYFLRYRNKF